MEQGPVLSFSTPPAAGQRVRAIISPTLELAYALYFLSQHPRSAHRRGDLPWLEGVYQNAPDLPEAISRLWPDDPKHAGLELFWLVCVPGYAQDETPERFLGDLPGLPSRFAGQPQEREEAVLSEHEQKTSALIRARLAALAQPDIMEHYAALLTRLWQHLEPYWTEDGHSAAQRARQALSARLDDGQDVLSALPPHHFTQFEAGAEAIRAAQSSGRLLVVPLTVALGGGFTFDMEGVHYLGYGLHSEDTFAELRARAEAEAVRIKALADPTRLMLLALISRYAGFAITVGDLARQLGVSQPTASGHLKLLREAGLVTPEKCGTRTYYRLEPEQVAGLAPALEGLLGFNR